MSAVAAAVSGGDGLAGTDRAFGHAQVCPGVRVNDGMMIPSSPCAPDPRQAPQARALGARAGAPAPAGRRRIRLRAVAASACIVLLAAGCSTTPTELANRVLPGSPLVPDYSIPISRSLSIPLEAAIGAAVVYWFVDPLGPNWEVAERRMSPTLVHLSLRRKRLATGGDGEPPQIVRRRATELALKAGFGGYEIVEYSESTDSETIGARRVTTALVKLTNERPLRIP